MLNFNLLEKAVNPTQVSTPYIFSKSYNSSLETLLIFVTLFMSLLNNLTNCVLVVYATVAFYCTLLSS